MNDEQRAESIVRALHGKVPPWASGACVVRDDAPAETYLGYDVVFEDATLEAVGQTGVRSCYIDPRTGAPRFAVFRRPSRQAIRKYGVAHYPVMLEGIMNGYGPPPHHNDLMQIAARIGGRYVALACIRGKRGPVRFDPRKRLGFVVGEVQNTETGSIVDQVCEDPEWLIASIALHRRYEWRVAMRIDGAPALTFACTPGSARSAYRLRDLPPGKNRRDALLHWVCEHYRNPDIHVSEHLRGKHTFSWRGIECEIVPSAFDREKEIARKQRKGAA